MIRVATKEDIPKLIEIAEVHLSSCSYSGFEFDRQKTEYALEELIDEDGFLIVYEKDGEIIGGMAGDVVTMWFSNTRIGTERIIYVLPEHRAGRIALRMILAWKKWCELQGCKYIKASITSGNTQVAKLYEAIGLKYVGPNFMMEI